MSHGYGEGDNKQNLRVWDMKPKGGDAPVVLTIPVIDAQEWVARDPERYAYHTPGEPPPSAAEATHR